MMTQSKKLDLLWTWLQYPLLQEALERCVRHPAHLIQVQLTSRKPEREMSQEWLPTEHNRRLLARVRLLLHTAELLLHLRVSESQYYKVIMSANTISQG